VSYMDKINPINELRFFVKVNNVEMNEFKINFIFITFRNALFLFNKL